MFKILKEQNQFENDRVFNVAEELTLNSTTLTENSDFESLLNIGKDDLDDIKNDLGLDEGCSSGKGKKKMILNDDEDDLDDLDSMDDDEIAEDLLDEAAIEYIINEASDSNDYDDDEDIDDIDDDELEFDADKDDFDVTDDEISELEDEIDTNGDGEIDDDEVDSLF